MGALYINYFDNIDKVFITLSVIIFCTGAMYRLSILLGKPMIIGGLLSGVLLSHIPLSTKYFDIQSCSIFGSLGIVFFLMFIGSQFNFSRIIRSKFHRTVPFILIFIPFVVGALMIWVLLKFKMVDLYGQKHIILIAGYLGLTVSVTSLSMITMFINYSYFKFSKVGKLAIFTASIGEIAFWLIFGVILIYFQQNETLVLERSIGLAVYVVFLLHVAPKLIKYFVSKIETQIAMLWFLIIGCLISAVIADMVNLHQVFGGFIFGVLLPKHNVLINKVRAQLDSFVSIILLPVFFVKTGMDASVNIKFDSVSIYLSIIFIVIVIIAKYGSAIIGGKLAHISVKDSFVLGSFMSIRGVTEIAILSVGREIGLINQNTFTALVVMVMVTTWLGTNITTYYNSKTAKNSKKINFHADT